MREDKMKKAITLLICLFLSLIFTEQIIAEDDVTELILFGNEVIGVTKFKQPLFEAPSSVSVFNSEQITNLGITKLSELLRLVPGIYITESERHLEKIFIRGVGTSSSYNDKILLLLDGIPQREIFFGHAFIDEYLPVENIEKIEVIKSPSSSLYGTNAFGGVINIITKKPDKLKSSSISLGLGSSEARLLSFGHYQYMMDCEFSIYARSYDSKGEGQEYSRKFKRNSKEEDPFSSRYIGFKYNTGEFFINGKYIEFHHKYTTNWDLPTEIWDENWFHYENYFLDIGYDYKLNNKSDLMFRTWWEYYNNTNFWQKTDSDINTQTVVIADVWPVKTTQSASFQVQFNNIRERNKFIAGAQLDYDDIIELEDYEYNRATGELVEPSDYWMPPLSRKNYISYLEDIFSITKNLDLTLGIRNDHHQVYGSHTSPRTALVYYLDGIFSLKLLYSESFRAPSYKELYIRSGSFTEGNEELDPELIAMTELEFDWNILKKINMQFNVYQSEVTDLIYREDETYINSESIIEVQGFEYLFNYKHSRLDLTLNYTRYMAKEKDSDLYLHSQPRDMANMYFTYELKEGFYLSSTVSWVGRRKRIDDDFNKYDERYPYGEPRPDIPAYINTNLIISRVLEDLTLRLIINNLFDEKQYDANEDPGKFDTQLPGRRVLFTVKYKF